MAHLLVCSKKELGLPGILQELIKFVFTLIENGHLGDWSPEKDCYWRLTEHIFTANHIAGLPTATLSNEQSNRSPGFLNIQVTKNTGL